MRSAIVLTACLAMAPGCSTVPRQPEINRAQIEPAELKPGDSALISVELQDKFSIVSRVVGIVKEDPSIQFELKDDGLPPDEAANDGTWSILVDVPFNAPPGEFVFDIKTYDESGGEVLVLDEEGNTVPLGSSFGLVIRFPQVETEE